MSAQLKQIFHAAGVNLALVELSGSYRTRKYVPSRDEAMLPVDQQPGKTAGAPSCQQALFLSP